MLRLWRVAVRVVRAFVRNRGVLLAGGVGYNTLLSLVPFLTLTIAALSLFFDKDRILEMLRPELAAMVPKHADILLQTARTFLENQAASGAVSIALLLFFSSVSLRMLEEAVAAIFMSSSEGAHRSFWRSALLPFVFLLPVMIASFLMTLLTIGVDALGDGSIRFLGLELSVAFGARWVLRFAGFLGLVLLFAGLYRFLPVVKVSLRRALIGGLCAAVLWRIAGVAMVYYFANISTVNVVYGSLATVVVVLVFLEVTFIIVLLGAQVIAELEASASAGLPWYESQAVAGESPDVPRASTRPLPPPGEASRILRRCSSAPQLSDSRAPSLIARHSRAPGSCASGHERPFGFPRPLATRTNSAMKPRRGAGRVGAPVGSCVESDQRQGGNHVRS